jgi:hypothetical protein
MGRPLSSVWTFFNKFILPLAFIAIAIYGLAYLWFHPDDAVFNHGLGISLESRWLFTAGFGVVIPLTVWSSWRMKRVTLVSDGIWVSDYVTESHIPFTAIGKVRESLYSRRPLVIVEFKDKTAFGRRITFMPADGTALPDLAMRLAEARQRDSSRLSPRPRRG